MGKTWRRPGKAPMPWAIRRYQISEWIVLIAYVLGAAVLARVFFEILQRILL